MIRRILPLLLAAILLAGNSVLPQTGAFKFRGDRIRPGLVLHYSKTNVDGTQLESVALYFASADRVEAFKYQEKGTRAGLVTAELDWESMSARRLDSWQVFSPSDRRLFATLEFNAADKTVKLSIPSARPEPEVVKIERLPFHLYNFDLASLNAALPHLIDPKKPFTVGLADPTFNETGPLFAYKGDMNVEFEKAELRNGVKCLRYSANGTGLNGHGTIWVNKKQLYIEDMEFDVPNNPEWKSYKLRLVKKETKSAEEWQRFIASHF